MSLDYVQITQLGYDSELTDGSRRLAGAKLKRMIDFIGALAGLIILAPFLLLIALLIRLESGGPALFRQRRTGYDHVPFTVYKFRTMECMQDGPDIHQAKRDDDRATRLGLILRRTSIDELPNLINVLKGEMSLVGPRPHALAHDRLWSVAVRDYDARFMVKPGITGLAQVEGFRGETPNIECVAGRVAKDLEYIRNWSLALDFKILLRTLMIGPFDPAAY
jgi:lipopolysaccharide/colanic/teichoic acid biosynthesis glycosyltransferase